MSTQADRDQQLALISKETEAVTARINALEIIDQPSMDEAIGLREGLKKGIDVLAALLDPPVEEAHQMHKSALRRRDEYISGPQLALGLIKRKILVAEKAEEARQKKLHDEALEKAKKEAEDKQLEAAISLEGQGMGAVADIVLGAEPVATLPPTAIPERRFEKPRGVKCRTYWSAVVDSKTALIMAASNKQPLQDLVSAWVKLAETPGDMDPTCALAEAKIYRQCAFALGSALEAMGPKVSEEVLTPNERFLNKLADTMKGEFNVPGCHQESREVPL
jgi:hypothetical protein